MDFTMSESSCQKLEIIFSLLFLVFHLVLINILLEKQKEIWQTFFFLSIWDIQMEHIKDIDAKE